MSHKYSIRSYVIMIALITVLFSILLSSCSTSKEDFGKATGQYDFEAYEEGSGSSNQPKRKRTKRNSSPDTRPIIITPSPSMWRKYKMEFQALHILVASMFCNFIVLGISINRPDSFYPVSLSAISISLQGLALRHFAIISVTWIIYSVSGFR